MRRHLINAVVIAAMSINVGCIVPMYSSNPDARARQLIFTSEGFRQIPETWERTWFLDMPNLMTPYRVHGGVI